MPTPLLFSEFARSPVDHVPLEERWNARRVYFATTRERVENLQRIDYGNEESDRLSVGLAVIRFGERGVTWEDLEAASRSPQRTEAFPLALSGVIEAGVLNSAEATPPTTADLTGPAAWLMADLNATLARARDKDLILYVHGAKVNFYNACAYAAQLDHFMGRDMTAFAFAWPSRQNIFAYGLGDDVDRAYRSAPDLTQLIELLARQSDARRIHLIAWSAGGRLLTAALEGLRARAGDLDEAGLRERYRLGTVYLAAADVPGDEFVRSLPRIAPLAQRIVVTASSRDGALQKAKLLMGGADRIGQVVDTAPAEAVEIVAKTRNLEIIDVSRGSVARGFDITGHRYWFDHPWASSDLILAIRSDLPPAQRGLEPSTFPVLWSIPEDYPDRLRAALGQPDLEIRQYP